MKNILLFILFMVSCFTLASQDNKVDYYINKAELHIENKEFEEAINTLTKAIEDIPSEVDFYDMRGTLYEAFHLFEKAKEDFTTGIELTDDSLMKSHLYSNLGGTKYRLRNFEGGYEDLKMAIKFDQKNVDALNNLAAICNEIGKTDESIQYLEQVIDIAPNYSPAYINLGFIYQENKEHHKAISYFDKAIDIDPESGLGFSNRSFSYLKLREFQKAMKDIKKAIKLYPTNSYAYKIKALINIEKNNFENACEDLNEAIELGYSEQYGDEVNELKEKYCQ